MGDTEIVPLRVQNVLDSEIIRLNLWSMKFNATSFKLEGFVRNEEGTMMQKVCSEFICRRFTSTLLFDVSGRFFDLVGQIDREYQQKMGMPSRIIDEFSNGIPENWADLIYSCMSANQRSALRPIQQAPKEPIRTRTEPIVTLADETELTGGCQKNSENEKERNRREREEQQTKERERRLEEEKQRRDAEAEAERRRKEEEELEEANYTLRAPKSQNGEPITPIRFTRGHDNGGAKKVFIFEQTPVRKQGPIASSTPQQKQRLADGANNQIPPTQKSQDSVQAVQPPPPRPAARNAQFASDADLFAVPKAPPSKSVRNLAASNVDIFADVDSVLDTFHFESTPGRVRKPGRRNVSSPSPEPRHRSSSRDGYEQSRYSQRYEHDNSRWSRHNATYRRHEDESRMSRKRSIVRDDFEYSRRHDDGARRRDYYDADIQGDSKRYRGRDASSSSGRSVRFEEEHRRHGDEYRDPRGPRDYNDYGRRRNHANSRSGEDEEKLNAIVRREKELRNRLQKSQKASSSSYRHRSNSSDAEESLNEWDIENQELLDNSMMFGDGIPKRSNARKDKFVKKQATRSKPANSTKSPAQARKKKRASLEDNRDLNDSIACNRPRRSCVTPVAKKITWRKQDLDRLKRVIALKKPSASDADWTEVLRLLAKEGVVEPEVVRQIAITRLKWVEPEQNEEVLKQVEEVEQKRRRGAVARVKENVKMHEELREGGNHRAEDLQSGVESMEDYQPEDVAADQSLLALRTPIVTKKRGGTRASIMPKPVEDSPMSRGNNSTFNSPRLEQTKAKDIETNFKYVQHLSMMQARPSSRLKKSSSMNNSTYRGNKNTSISLEKGTQKALKIINRGTTIHEDDENEDNDDDDDMREEDTSIY
ncbi:Kinetochore null protein 2 [Caenorhabditis elegans]|uniref:Kinetochore null protein 2 n=1 Tax=Caenorhabditis elegans TaxID=6239 RepID=KNL2_CAEEL|nr:Kinetochore null protein 2 [Caenorhabditis elegans]O44548.2 RecName: Full=Kinetochore null protein 2 [Caenorhabditis elegans]CCD68114.1 Kinetochore null protein 2 [Caenorhabditis elegans]|eukprot:NP_491858.1 Kinetochore null protein 2 [Caenorhabditis elegans]